MKYEVRNMRLTMDPLEVGERVTIEYPGRGFVTGKVKHTYPNGDLIVQEGRYRPRYFPRERIVRVMRDEFRHY